MLQEQQLGISPTPSRGVDLYYAPGPISNHQVEKMWARVIRLLPRWIMIPAFKFNSIFPMSARHTVPSASAGALDVHNILDSTIPLLHFSNHEEIVGRKLLDELELEPGKYVCVVARDPSYYEAALPKSDLSYHNYRNCRIETYLEALDALTDLGLHAIRMGSIVSSKLNTANTRIIDYSNSLHRSDFADVYLAANCKFMISDGLGFFALPAAFRRPNAFVNFSPFHLFYSSRWSDVGVTKLFADRDSGRVLPLRELVNKGVSRLTRSELIQNAGLRVIDNSPAEITDLVLEMNSRIDGTWVPDDEDEELQSRFWFMFRKVIGDEGLQKHGEFRARFGAKYLRNNVDWFAE